MNEDTKAKLTIMVAIGIILVTVIVAAYYIGWMLGG